MITDRPTSPDSMKNPAWRDYWLAHLTPTQQMPNDAAPDSTRMPTQASQAAQPMLVTTPARTRLPDASMNSWGGGDASRWRPEAILANAVSEALNEAWSQTGVQDVLIAVPLKMRNSSVRPYGDGQTNASLAFQDSKVATVASPAAAATWSYSRPQLVASWILKTDGTRELRLRFHQALELNRKTVQLVYQHDQQRLTKRLTLASLPSGDTGAAWTPGADEMPSWGTLFQNNVAFVQPDGATDWYPLDFRDVVQPAGTLLAQLPLAQQKLGRGTRLDPENVSVQSSGVGYPWLGMKAENFGQDINADRYFPVPGSGIHNEFPESDGTHITAVGHGNTLVMIRPPSTFKSAYICFDARNPDAEATYGVPSGGGWHEIGDPAETVFNTLENSSVVFGYANGQPAATTPSGGFAFGLTDIAVIRLLQPGSALITAAGPVTFIEDAAGYDHRGTTPRTDGRNYHWFIFDQPHEVCAVEWVHPKIPSPTNHVGMDAN